MVKAKNFGRRFKSQIVISNLQERKIKIYRKR